MMSNRTICNWVPDGRRATRKYTLNSLPNHKLGKPKTIDVTVAKRRFVIDRTRGPSDPEKNGIDSKTEAINA